MQKINSVKGMKDLFGEELIKHQYLRKIFRKLCAFFNEKINWTWSYPQFSIRKWKGNGGGRIQFFMRKRKDTRKKIMELAPMLNKKVQGKWRCINLKNERVRKMERSPIINKNVQGKLSFIVQHLVCKCSYLDC